MRRALFLVCAVLPLQGCALPLLVAGGIVGGNLAAPRDAEGRKCYGPLGCAETDDSLGKALRERQAGNREARR